MPETSHEFLNVDVVGNGAGVAGGHGILLGTSENLVQGCLVQGNGNDTDGWGIKISQGDGNMALNNVVWQNGNGISVGDGKPVGTQLYHNTVYGNAGTGIVIRADSVDTSIHWLKSLSHT